MRSQVLSVRPSSYAKFANVLVGWLLLAACSSDAPRPLPDDVLTHNDFEAVIGWNTGNNVGSLSRDVARSGRYALKVDAAQEFSLTFDARLGDLTARPPRAIRVEAWLRVPSGAAGGAQLVTSVGAAAGGPALTEDRAVLGDVVYAAGEWIHVARELALPATTRPDHHVRVYLLARRRPSPRLPRRPAADGVALINALVGAGLPLRRSSGHNPP